MAYEIRALNIASGVSIDIEKDSLQYRMATGKTINSFYYDSEAHTARWNYCGREYRLSNICYDHITLAKDMNSFCGYNSGCEDVDIYDAVGTLILRYHVGDDTEFPLSLGDDMILYCFMTNNELWWIYKGKRRCVNVELGTEKAVVGFHSSRYVKVMSRLRDVVYNAEGDIVYQREKYPPSLTIGGVAVAADGVTPLILERYGLVAVCTHGEDYCYSSISLYDFHGRLHATVPLPENTAAFHSIKLLEHTDIPVIACYEELPDTSHYFNNGIARSVRPNMPMKLRWYELLPNEKGELALYKSGELYQGFRDIDTYTLEDRHIRWR